VEDVENKEDMKGKGLDFLEREFVDFETWEAKKIKILSHFAAVTEN
jgi:phosphoglycerate dehydrogenase-like enzyme